jgi:hypothetical protein
VFKDVFTKDLFTTCAPTICGRRGTSLDIPQVSSMITLELWDAMKEVSVGILHNNPLMQVEWVCVVGPKIISEPMSTRNSSAVSHDGREGAPDAVALALP